jgi:outer membrane lipoprotein-sorting protein
MPAFAIRRHLWTIYALLAFAGVAANAAEPPIIAKARAFLGSETALNNVKSIHYSGTLLAPDPKDATKQTRVAMEIIFQKPEQQRITITSDKEIETTALDGYEGWLRKQDATDPSKWRLTLLGTEQIKRMRANMWENLSFFRGLEKFGGRVEDQGTQTIDGVTCQKVAFIHGPNIIFYRYFDVATGKLIFTETEAGGTIREQGEMIVDGIRFPRSIITASGAKDAKGQPPSVTINFDKITVNETIPPKEFAVPPLGRP